MTSMVRMWSLGMALLALTGCTVLDPKKEPPPCPGVSILGDAAKLTRFRPGPGRDITDVELEAEILGYHGSCQYDGEKKVMSVLMQVNLSVQRGPAAEGRTGHLAYFLALPAFLSTPGGKQIFPLALDFPDGSDGILYTDKEVLLTLPLKDMKDLPNDAIVLGLQLEPSEAEYNRSLKRH